MRADSRSIGRDWLVLGQERWDGIQRRNQLLFRRLAARDPCRRFLFVEIALRLRSTGEWHLPRVRRVEHNIWTVRPIRPLPSALSRLSDRIEAAQIRAAARRVGLEAPLVWTQDPHAADLLPYLDVDGLVYDLTDDWAALQRNERRRRAMQGRIERLGDMAMTVFACSRPLEAGARVWHRNVHYLPNAVDTPSRPPAPAPDLELLPRPRLGYVGTLHSARLDAGLVAEIARRRQDWTILLAGPNLLEQPDRELLDACPNVRLLAERPHEQVPAVLAGLDVGLIPHRRTDFTLSLDPLKIYEYLNAGLPVVGAGVTVPDGLESHVTVARGPDAFEAACARALAGDQQAAPEARRASVASETWAARADTVAAVLTKALRPAERPGVSAVIVSYNTRELLRRCLEQVRAQRGVSVQTIVIDNASSDGSPEMVRDEFPEVELVALDENKGFGPANNVGFAAAREELVLLLNSDAFLEPDSVAAMVDALLAHPSAAVVGPRLRNPDGSLQRSAWPWPASGRLLLESVGLHRPLRRLGLLEDLGTWAHDQERRVDFLIGACLLIRHQALRDVGGFDEAFWLYGEEADLERRITERGWSVLFSPSTSVEHIGGASSTDDARRLRSFYGGQRLFLERHGGPLAWPLAWVALVVGALLRRRFTVVRIAFRLAPGSGGP